MTMMQLVGRKLRTTACAYQAFGPASLIPLTRHALLRMPGLRRDSTADAPEISADASIKQRFTGIFRSGHWNMTGSVSGHGSTVCSTMPYRAQLVDYLRSTKAASMLDAPCGDFSWMPLVLKEVDVRYTGGDIVDELVQQNRMNHPELDFRTLDITSDRLPSADVLHCRDCLFHLSYEDIAGVFERILKSDIRNLLLTTFLFRTRGLNADIVSGRYRFLDLTDSPIGFPPPARRLVDFRPWIDFPKYVGAWAREDIEAPMDAFVRAVRSGSVRQ